MSFFKVSSINSGTLDRINPLLLPLPWLLVLVLIGVFAAMKYSGTEEAKIVPAQTAKLFPHVFITDVEVRQFDHEGAIHYQMNTPLIRHFQINAKPSNLDYSLFETPVFMLVNDPNKPGWFVTAQEGRREDDGLWFILTKDVLARHTSEKEGEITISTNDLRLNTQDQFAETSKAVTMRDAKSQTTALGLRADLKREHIELLSHVKGTHEP